MDTTTIEKMVGRLVYQNDLEDMKKGKLFLLLIFIILVCIVISFIVLNERKVGNKMEQDIDFLNTYLREKS